MSFIQFVTNTEKSVVLAFYWPLFSPYLFHLPEQIFKAYIILMLTRIQSTYSVRLISRGIYSSTSKYFLPIISCVVNIFIFLNKIIQITAVMLLNKKKLPQSIKSIDGWLTYLNKFILIVGSFRF